MASVFGPFISQCVALPTDESGASRKEQKDKIYEKLAGVSSKLELALIIKVADRLANLRACLEHSNHGLLSMYKKEHPIFRHSVYRAKLCEDIWCELDKTANS